MKRVKQTYLLGLTWCTIVLVLSYAAIFFFPEILISMFNSEGGELAEIALNGIRLYLCVVPLIGVQMTATNYFQATGRPKFAMIIGLTRQVLFFVPALLILPNMFGLRGVWMSGALADGCAVTLSAVIMIFELLRLNKHKEPSEVQVEAE